MASPRWFTALPFLVFFTAPAEAAVNAVLDCTAETQPPTRYIFTIKDSVATTKGQGGDPYNINAAKFFDFKKDDEKNSYVFGDRNAGLFLLIDRETKPNAPIGMLMGPILSTDPRKPVAFGCKLTGGSLKS